MKHLCSWPSYGVPGQEWKCNDCGKEFTAQLMEDALLHANNPPGDYPAGAIVWFGSDLLAALKDTRRENRRVRAKGGVDSPKTIEIEVEQNEDENDFNMASHGDEFSGCVFRV